MREGRWREMVKKLSKDIGLKSKKDGLLEFFYVNPLGRFTVRELAAKTGLSRSTVQYQLQKLKVENIVSKNNQWIDNWHNRFQKTNYYIKRMADTGLIDYLEKELAASAIILFGSFRKGESVKESDIDFFVECAREKKLDLTMFERSLGHKIQLFTKPKITKLPTHLLNNVVNGIKLQGYFTIK
ncbi:winged helix-turn-helix transcriptional regulator [Candidatus Woesearchaeota archaeon]|nr:winged helix-turn-helix transcriptional regulator [Candidatus Woesearchaeota archaeon]